MSFLVKKEKKTCWFNKSNFKAKFAMGMNNYGLDGTVRFSVFYCYICLKKMILRNI